MGQVVVSYQSVCKIQNFKEPILGSFFLLIANLSELE